MLSSRMASLPRDQRSLRSSFFYGHCLCWSGTQHIWFVCRLGCAFPFRRRGASPLLYFSVVVLSIFYSLFHLDWERFAGASMLACVCTARHGLVHCPLLSCGTPVSSRTRADFHDALRGGRRSVFDVHCSIIIASSNPIRPVLFDAELRRSYADLISLVK